MQGLEESSEPPPPSLRMASDSTVLPTPSLVQGSQSVNDALFHSVHRTDIGNQSISDALPVLCTGKNNNHVA
jgi:hypothetical protein